MAKAPTILTKDQDNAVNTFLDFLVNDDNFLVIQGAAGTGKSFLIKHLLETFYAKYQSYCLLLQKEVKDFDIKVTATTNKAVSVIEDFLDNFANQKNIEIKTIFSLLGLRVYNDNNTGKTTLSFGQDQSVKFSSSQGVIPLILIDEASFIDVELHSIIESVLQKQFNAKIVYIGDQYQLAPVGQTFSVMESLQCTKVTLNEIIRNKGKILETGTQFRHTVETQQFNPINYNDKDVIHLDGPAFQAAVEASFSRPDWSPNVSKILAWQNKQVQAYNKHIRAALNLTDKFEVGERVITNNFILGRNYTRSIDSTVLITDIDKQPSEHYNVSGHLVELDNRHVGFMPTDFSKVKALLNSIAKEAKSNKKLWPRFFEIKDNWLDLRAAYASSVHKAQGSTYETVFLDLSDIGKNWNAMDVARLMYVGITRASKQVVCYGYLPNKYC